MDSKIKILIMFFVIILALPKIYSLKLLEPIYTEITGSEIDIGVVAPGEFFLISFLQDQENKFTEIRVAEESRNIASTELTQFTPESIFTTIKISKEISGNQILTLELISEKETKKINLNVNVTNDVISIVTQNYETLSEYGKLKEITITVINKSVTTKQVTLTSNLPKNWFAYENEVIEQDIIRTVQPVSKTDIKYKFVPKGVGDKEFRIFLYTKNAPKENYLRSIENIFDDFKRSEIDIKINIIKDVKAIYSANQYYFPLYGLNSLPIYFFNNIVRILDK
jgi:hypothetical protein